MVASVLLAATLAGCGSVTAAGRPVRGPASPGGSVGRHGPRPVPSSGAVPTLVYSSARGVAIVGVGPVGSAPPRLYLGTAGPRWRNVTPPGSRRAGTSQLFEQASFLSRSTGWVTAWDPSTDRTTIFRTADGGRSWTAIPGGFQTGAAGAATLVDLVSPRTAFEEHLEPTAPRMTLAVTTDAGRSWKVVFREPLPAPAAVPAGGPWLVPVTFAGAERGFAAAGLPPSEPEVRTAGLFATADGGSTWEHVSPPLPTTSERCRARATSAARCLYGLPVFTGPRRGVLAAVASAGRRALVAFDVTTDAGIRWRRAAQVSLPVAPHRSGPDYPLTSVSASSWWVLGWSGRTATVDTTSSEGARWTTRWGVVPDGVPIGLSAIGRTDALLVVRAGGPGGSTTRLLFTADAGRRWTPPSLP